MQPGAVVLVNGPTDDPAWWQSQLTPIGTAMADCPVVAPPVVADATPFGTAWVASAARPLHALGLAGPLVLVGHGTAGPLLPALARTQRAAGRRIGAYVFVDATLPRPGQTTHLDLLRAADPALADAAHEALHRPGAIWPEVSGQAQGQAQGHDFWTETLPPALDWPDAPAAYLRTGAEVPETGGTAFWARSARARAWKVVESPDLAHHVAELITALP